MLETAELHHTIAKATYARQQPKLREALINAQYDLSQRAGGPLLMIVSGVEGGGRSETANTLNAWMDPRHIRVVAFGPRTEEERMRPLAWRYWNALPPRGTIGIHMDGWYAEAMDTFRDGHVDPARFERSVAAIRQRERMLADEGVALLKLWMHLPDDVLQARLDELDRRRKRRLVAPHDLQRARVYSRMRGLCEALLRETSTAEAPWIVVEGTDERYRGLTAGRLVLASLQHAVRNARPAKSRPLRGPAPTPAVVDNVKLLRDLDLSLRLDDKTYETELAKWQARLVAATRRKRFRDVSLVLAFEGVDAAGKGGAIRRVASTLDARQYVIVPIAAPSDEERKFPYLWRFWRHVPRRGGITVFDRTWYGRVLVERVEGFASVPDWNRAYSEINQFEEDLAEGGAVIVKFWLQISKEEQYRRFKAREQTSFKRFKITQDDWRNRKKWDAYQHAVADMVDRTSTEIAPWTLVEAEDKNYARIKVLKTIVKRLERALD